MSDESLELVEHKINMRLSDFKSKKETHRKRHLTLTIAVGIIGLVSTILLGLNLESEPEQETIRITVLSMNALVIFLSTIITMFGDKSFWIKYNDTCNDFRDLSFEIEFRKTHSPEITEQEIKKFKERYQEILYRTNDSWTAFRSKQKSDK
ncbi:MAG: DUF4231 domain-containing protein [Roseivirga sp.]|nr:DUF4231 domain-containing protein [Roseivirga sp.]